MNRNALSWWQKARHSERGCGSLHDGAVDLFSCSLVPLQSLLSVLGRPLLFNSYLQSSVCGSHTLTGIVLPHFVSHVLQKCSGCILYMFLVCTRINVKPDSSSSWFELLIRSWPQNAAALGLDGMHHQPWGRR